MSHGQDGELHRPGQCVSYPPGEGGAGVSRNFRVDGLPAPPPPLSAESAVVGDFGSAPKAQVKAFCTDFQFCMSICWGGGPIPPPPLWGWEISGSLGFQNICSAGVSEITPRPPPWPGVPRAASGSSSQVTGGMGRRVHCLCMIGPGVPGGSSTVGFAREKASGVREGPQKPCRAGGAKG